MEIHPFCLFLPALKPKEYAALKANIKEVGLTDPILLYEGKILDGRHRHRACQELAIEPIYTQFDGDNPRERVLGRILARQLSKSQRAMIAAKSATATVGRPKSHAEGANNDDPLTMEGAAAKMGVGRGSVDKAKSISSQILIDAVSDGIITIGLAIKLEELSPDSQQAALNEIEEGKKLRDSDNAAIKAAVTPNGSAPKAYKDKDFLQCYDKLCRLVEERSKKYGSSAHHKKVRGDLNTLMADFREWAKQEAAPF